jgi:hypothetical protein
MVSPRFRMAVAVVTAALVWGPAAAAPAGGGARPPQCSAHREGQLTVGTLSVRSKGVRPFTLEQRSTRNLDTGVVTVNATVRRGKQVALQLEATLETSGAGAGRILYGRGFKGIHEVTFTTDGTTVRGVIDGRRTVAVPVGAAPDALVFEDGQPAPTLRAKPLLRKALAKLGRQASAGCPPASLGGSGLAAAVVLKDPLPPDPARGVDPSGSTDCIWCQAKCAAEYVACLSGAVATGPFVIFSGPTCLVRGGDCLNDCVAPGKACCPKKCGGLCCTADTTCCGDFACCSPGSHCASPSFGICCPAGAQACSGGCCAVGEKCVEGVYCCPADAGDYCGQELGCCPPGQRCYQDKDSEGVIIDQVCCDREPCINNTCCPAGQVCSSTGCCNPTDVCGGACCPRADGNVCLNGTTCCQAGKVCGGGCCPGFAICCNGTCCPNLGDRCIGGLCCPENRACGSTCCPEGYACTNPATGTCQPCAAGEEPCPQFPGNPLCCPRGSQCCGNGQCCGSPLVCCGNPPACRDSSVCLR